eukprot:CAMPEP_0173058008 /NCGR_PEP_ID=MMETSP1102-20130122/1100_1 /TAXON_ID=49646 /ORGANISM="Geminigera sp., Strain Caron Lab Isolate" /LENGTH=49 /DNA_ID=CAMNT_0013923673 /DNA_START=118 /DNA_END=268 /DNA_ORIENTATION=+
MPQATHAWFLVLHMCDHGLQRRQQWALRQRVGTASLTKAEVPCHGLEVG